MFDTTIERNEEGRAPPRMTERDSSPQKLPDFRQFLSVMFRQSHKQIVPGRVRSRWFAASSSGRRECHSRLLRGRKSLSFVWVWWNTWHINLERATRILKNASECGNFHVRSMFDERIKELSRKRRISFCQQVRTAHGRAWHVMRWADRRSTEPLCVRIIFGNPKCNQF